MIYSKVLVCKIFSPSRIGITRTELNIKEPDPMKNGRLS